MRPSRSGLLLRWSSLALSAYLTAVPTWGQLPPPTLRFESVITDGFYWFHDFEQDPTGFLWTATESGLDRYDGYSVRSFRTAPGDPTTLPANVIHAIAAAPDGDLWLASLSQLGRINSVSGHYETVLARQTWDLAFDGAGALWTVGNDEPNGPWSVQRRAPDGAWQDVPVFGEDRGAVSGTPPRLATSATGAIWIPGYAHGLARAAPRDDGTYTLAHWRPADLSADMVHAVRVGGDQSLWVRTNRGYHRSVGEDFPLVLPFDRLPPIAHMVRDFLVDRRGLLWLALSDADGVMVVDPSSGAHVQFAHRVDEPTSLPDARIARLYEDRAGVLWFGTTAGLYKAVPRWEAFHTYPLPMPDLAVTLGLDRQQRLWAGALCGPLWVFNEGRFTQAEELLPGLESPACPMRLLEDRGGGLWIGAFPLSSSHSGGLVRYNPATETTTRYRQNPGDPAALGSLRIRALLADQQGRLWIGGEEGLDRYDPATDGFVPYRHDPDDPGTLAGNIIWSLAETPDGTLWVGAQGLNRLDPTTGRVTRYPPNPTDPTSLPSGALTWIHVARHDAGVLWIGTYDGGLARLNIETGLVVRYTEAEGLPDNYVKAVLEDESGRIWAPTQGGLARLDPATGEILVFDEADGLHSRTFGLYDAAVLPDGRFALAHQDALVVFHPDSVEAVRGETPLALTTFRIFDEEVPVSSRPEILRLNHDDNFFSFEFAALDFAAPEQTRYAYRLDGFDEGWIESGTRRYAAYTNLPPGYYTFRARADTGGGWSEQELAVSVVIAPAWWQTAWFQLLAGLAGLVALGGFVRFTSTRRLRRQLRTLEVERRLQAERERISQDLHDHVGAQLSTIISGIDLARLSGVDRAAPRPDHLDRLEAHARQTMGQLRETIWALHREAVTLGTFHTRLCAYAREQTALRADAPALRCTLNAETDWTLTPAQTLHLYRIAQEAIQNALKHADASRLDVTLQVESDLFVLDVSDDGCFAESGAPDALCGYGLQGMRRRAEALGATFELETSGGTRVRITVPLG